MVPKRCEKLPTCHRQAKPSPDGAEIVGLTQEGYQEIYPLTYLYPARSKGFEPPTF
jgi:hypothetical protein